MKRKMIEAQEHNVRLFREAAAFTKSVFKLEDLPVETRIEIAIAGRSNVGKSSLINRLFNRRDFARTSKVPGRTQSLNFYQLGDKINLVDMPGYGYAKAPKQLVAGWNQLIKDYLYGRVNLRRVLVLIDSRHGIKTSDEAILSLLDQAGVSTRVILTKRDKISQGQAQRMTDQIRQALIRHPCALPEPLLTSAEKQIGIETVQQDITALLDQL